MEILGGLIYMNLMYELLSSCSKEVCDVDKGWVENLELDPITHGELFPLKHSGQSFRIG